MGGIIELNDGSVLLAQTPIDNFLSIHPMQYIYFIRYGSDGLPLSMDSLIVPGFEISNYHYVNVCRGSNGSVLVYGNADSANGPYKSFVCNYYNRNWIWANSFFDFNLGNVTPTSDGGYLLAGYSTNLTLVKINSTGDSLWTRNFATSYPVSSVTNIVSAPNGNFYISFNSTTTNTIANILEVNSNGDSLRSVAYDGMSQNHRYTLLPMRGGKIVSLMNTIPVVSFPQYPPIFSQINSFYSEYDQNLNITGSGNFQTLTTDWLYSACITSDGDVACFGVMQSYKKNYFVPVLIKK